MTDENWTDEHERSLADLLGFDPTDERPDDVPEGVGTRLQDLFTDAIGDEPEIGFSPLAVIAAARRQADTARGDTRHRERAGSAAEYARRRRRSTVTKGVLIAAAAALVVVAVPTLFRGGSASDSASSAVSATSAAAATAEMNPAAAADSAGGGQSQAAAPEGATSAAASSAAASSAMSSEAASQSASTSRSGGMQAPAATALESSAAADSDTPPTPRADNQGDTAGSASAGGTGVESAPSSTPASSGSAAGATCVWPALGRDAVAAALRALDLPSSTPVQQPVRAACASDQVGAMTIPSAGITVLVARDPGLTSGPQYGYSDARSSATGGGISVLVVATPTGDPARAALSNAQRVSVARAVLAAVR